MNVLILCGAYGRTYTTKRHVAADWAKGLDFKVYPDGPYTSIRDVGLMRSMGVTEVKILGRNGTVLMDERLVTANERLALLSEIKNAWEGSIHGWKLSDVQTAAARMLENEGLLMWNEDTDCWEVVDVLP